MKVAIKNNDKVTDLTALKALNPSNNDIVYVESEDVCYYFHANMEERFATENHVAPDSGGGYWEKDVRVSKKYKVDDSYDFVGNDAEDITNYANVKELYEKGEANYFEYRTWLKSYVSSEGFQNLSSTQQKECAKHFVVDKTTRESVLTSAEISKAAENYVRRIDDSYEEERVKEEAEKIESSDSISESEAEIVNLSSVIGKDHTAINYRTELKDGVHLHKEETFTKEGLIDVVTYYYGYVDENNKGTEILRVEHQWTVDTDEPIPTAKAVESRTKIRKWKTKAGNYHTLQKTTSKTYDTTKKKNQEGKRRRDNVFFMTQEGLITILLYTGTSPDKLDAEDKLVALSETHNSAINSWMKSGKGSIYDDVTNDSTHTWLDTQIGTTARDALGLPSGWETNTARDFAVEKMKGNV